MEEEQFLKRGGDYRHTILGNFWDLDNHHNAYPTGDEGEEGVKAG